MVNVFSTILVALAAVGAQAQCANRCGVNQALSNGDTCVYDCSSDSVRSSQTNAANFAGALRQNGNDCSSNAGQVRCRRTPGFGGCGDHHWDTGRGC